MAYAAALKTQPPPLKKEEIHYLLAHFSSRFSNEDLISAVKRASGIIPLGIRPHPKGCLLAFSSLLSLETALAKPVRIGKTTVPLTPFPEIATPVAERGKRWRISGLEFWISAADIKEALVAAGTTPTEVKLETVKNFPTTRTPFATFWTKDEKPPSLKEIKGEKVLVFDPSPKTKPRPSEPPIQEPPARQAHAANGENSKIPAGQPSPPTSTSSHSDSPSPQSPGNVQHTTAGPSEDQDSMAVDPVSPKQPSQQPSSVEVAKTDVNDEVLYGQPGSCWDRAKMTIVVDLTPQQQKEFKKNGKGCFEETMKEVSPLMRALNLADNPPRWAFNFETQENYDRFWAHPLFWRGNKKAPLVKRKLKDGELDDIKAQMRP